MINRGILSFLLSLHLFNAIGQELFVESKVVDSSNGRIASYQASGKYKEIYEGKIDIRVLNAEQINFTLPGFSAQTFQAVNNTDKLWYGKALNEVDYITLVREGNQLIGSIFIDNKLFEIASLTDSTGVVTCLDVSKYQEEEDVRDKSIGNYEVPFSQTRAITTKPLRVLVAYTATAAALVTPSLTAHATLAIQTTNQTYEHSQISHRLELAACVQVGYAGAGNLQTDLELFVGKNDGVMDEIHTLRDRYAADVCVLVSESSGSTAGIAEAIGANEGNAFCVVDRSAAVGNLSFPHEIGHLQGARHDVGMDSSTSPFAYGHGYISPGKNWRTVMAYGNYCNNCVRVAYWSNPNVTYPGDGRAMGTTARENNARVLNDETERMKSFRNPASSVSLSNCVIRGGEYAYVIASSEVKNSGTVSIEANGRMQISAPTRVTLSSGFTAKAGSNLNVKIGNPEAANVLNDEVSEEAWENPTALESRKTAFNLQVSPLPVTDRASIRFELPGPGKVSITLRDFGGNPVDKVLAATSMEKGEQEVSFYKNGLAAGIYYLVLDYNRQIETFKLIIK